MERSNLRGDAMTSTFTPDQIQTRLNRAVGLPENVAGPRPAWAVAAIIAEHRVDQSDPQTDYFGSTQLGGVIVLAWSRHKRALFSEMRKAAARHPETAHLVHDIFTARVVTLDDSRGNGCPIWKGQDSPWHRELTCSFASQDEADAYIAGQPPILPLSVGEDEVRFGWKTQRTSVEHRENYSMGHGNYLSTGHFDHTGWKVRKQNYRLEELE
jgi:hypothetical protein